MIFAFRDLREVLDALSDENVAGFQQSAGQQASSSDKSDIAGKYDGLKEYYFRLEQLAEKNQVDKSGIEDAGLLLANAKRMIDDGNFEGAGTNLEHVNALLEEIRTSLFDKGVGEKLSSNTNTTSGVDEELKRKLADTADRFERVALKLLNETGSDTEAEAKVHDAISLLANAKASIDAQDLESAREGLSAAYKAINEARELLKG